VPGKEKQVFPASYQLNGNLLSIVVGTGKARPQTFTNTGNQILLVLKRAP
jgi:hypothetical protein